MDKNSKPKSKGQRPRNKRGNGKPQNQRHSDVEQDKKFEERSNNPNWYFFDEKLADQVSQLSFQNLAGYPIDYSGVKFDVPNVVRVTLNPAPGVQTSAMYSTALSQHSAINMSAFRLYSKLSAFTGRVQSYAPQDVAMMELAMGEVISITEWIRRAFGVAYTMNPRNRDYPRQVLEFGMLVDSNDLFQNLSDYRTRFNTIMVMINQLPIPRNIAYFDKCAALYQRIFLDAASSMAQTIVVNPHQTWIIDEQSYSGGTILKTTPVTCVYNGVPYSSPQPMSTYLTLLENMVYALLNSSSLQVVYTDILNYATKQSMDFWRMDYLMEGYTVLPEYDPNFLLQMHNATIIGWPSVANLDVGGGTYNVTPWNDVYPDPNKNSIFYNPGFPLVGYTTYPRTGSEVLIDMLTDSPSLTDRVEVTRYCSISAGTSYSVASPAFNGTVDVTLPDHYICTVYFEAQTNNLTAHGLSATILPESTGAFADLAAQLANIDWAPRIWEVDSNGAFTGRYTGDVNFYTIVDEHYLRKLHDFVGLALYDIR